MGSGTILFNHSRWYLYFSEDPKHHGICVQPNGGSTHYKVADLMLISGLPSMTIYDAKSGKRQPEKTTRNKLMEAIHELQHDSKGKLSFWRQLPDDLLATLCDVPIAIVKAMKYGKHNFTENEQKIIRRYCEEWSNKEQER